MANKLAQLDDLKSAVQASTDGIDAELTALLEAASAIAERVAGVVAGGLRRAVDQVAYPRALAAQQTVIALGHRPLESIVSVKLLYGPATEADFAGADELVEGVDFYLDGVELATVGLYNDWWRTTERSNRVVYTAGFADPDDPPGSGDELLPPEDLQRGVVMQATMLWNQRRTAGLKGVEAGGASGQLAETKVHPLLRDAAERYRRIGL